MYSLEGEGMKLISKTRHLTLFTIYCDRCHKEIKIKEKYIFAKGVGGLYFLHIGCYKYIQRKEIID